MPFMCVKCTDSHEPGQCQLLSEINNDNVKCVNCNGNHLANYRGCPKLKELEKKPYKIIEI